MGHYRKSTWLVKRKCCIESDPRTNYMCHVIKHVPDKTIVFNSFPIKTPEHELRLFAVAHGRFVEGLLLMSTHVVQWATWLVRFSESITRKCSISALIMSTLLLSPSREVNFSSSTDWMHYVCFVGHACLRIHESDGCSLHTNCIYVFHLAGSIQSSLYSRVRFSQHATYRWTPIPFFSLPT